MMPRLIFSLIIFLCFFQIYQNKSLKSENKDIIKRNAFITFGYTLFIVLIADKLGFLISVFLFTLITPILWQRKDYVKITLYSFSMTIFVFVYFTLILQLKFPQGILEDFIIRNFFYSLITNKKENLKILINGYKNLRICLVERQFKIFLRY